MKRKVVVWPEEAFPSRDQARRTITAEYFDGSLKVETKSAFFDVIGKGCGTPLATADWSILCVLFGAMRWKRDIIIKGPVSSALLHNLEEFQRAFSCWNPALRTVSIRADAEVSASGSRPDGAVVAFSGGVDAVFSTFRHIFKKPGQRHRNVKTAMLVHGFDLPLDKPEAFELAYAGAERMLAETGVNLAVVRTDMRHLLPGAWSHTFGAALAACLHQFSPSHSIGLIGSDEPYSQLVFPWGSNPVTNPLLSSDRLSIVTDGTGFTRTQKVAHIANWKPALADLRVCWQGPKTGRNCGRCEKCIRTILNFRAVGCDLPPAFASDVTDEQIRSIKVRNEVQRNYLADILAIAKKERPAEAWVQALDERLTAA